MRYLLSLLFREVRGLHEAAYLVALLTVIAQMTALGRDRIFAHVFGAGSTLDVYYAAFKLPDLLFALVSSLVSVYTLMPFLQEHWNDTSALRTFLSRMFSAYLAVAGFGAAVLYVSAPYSIPHLFSHLPSGHLDTLVSMTRILLLQPIILGISSLCAAVVQAHQRFIVYAIAPILYNVGIILGAVVLYPRYGDTGLAFGVLLGAMLHLGAQAPFVAYKRLTPTFTVCSVALVVRVLRVALPRTMTLSMQQAVLFVLIVLGTKLSEGTVTVFTFATNLVGVPLGVIGMSYSVAAFSKLSQLYAGKEQRGFFDTVTRATRHLLFWSFPCALFGIAFSVPLTTLLYQTGRFSENASALTGVTFACVLVGLVAQSLSLLFIRTLYAAGRTRPALRASTVGALVTLATAYVLLMVDIRYDLWYIALTGDTHSDTRVLSLALSLSIGSWATCVLLVRDVGLVAGSIVKAVRPAVLNSLLASLTGAVVGCGAYVLLMEPAYDFVQMFLVVSVSLVCGGACWFAIHRLLASDELAEVSSAIRKRAK